MKWLAGLGLSKIAQKAKDFCETDRAAFAHLARKVSV